MRRGSLRLRLIAGGVAAILIALTIAGVSLNILFERHVARALAEDLDVYLKQLISGVDVDSKGQLVVTRPPADPRFAEPLSGLYWQVADDKGQLLRSRSLWDTALALPKDEPAAGELHLHEGGGPGEARVLIAERRVSLTVNGRATPIRVAVAIDLARVSVAVRAFAKDLSVALGLLGAVLAMATSVQVALGLRPLDSLRRGLAEIRSGASRRLSQGAPTEVQPLVDEVNALLDAQEQEIERSRNRAADLAHGLKTPLAALASDAERLREQGDEETANSLEQVGEAMSRQVDREMARARARGAMRRGLAPSTELAPLVASLIATLSRAPAGSRLAFETHISEGLAIPLDRTDLAEVLGNLLENASRHASTRVRVTASRAPAGVMITIEDDGKGIAATDRSRALERGARLDQRGEGTGLGLAIALDVLEAYGWRLELDASNLGGLKAIIGP